MPSRLAFLSLLILSWFITSATAQDDGISHLDLVRGLRERGYHDLALEYLEKLRGQEAKLSPEVKSVLPLELARSRSDVAAQIPPSAERDQLLQKSRTELEAFLKTGPNQDAELALANTLAEQARSLASAASRAGIQEEKPQQKAVDLHKSAIARFDEADKLYAALQKKLEDQLGIRPETPGKTPAKNPPLPKVNPSYLATLYYRAQARYDKSRMAGLGIRDAGIANDEARQLAEKLAPFRTTSPVGWQGMALFARTLEGGDDTRAANIYRQVEASGSQLAIPAQRMARYFPLARADATGEVGELGQTRTQVRTLAERWLQLYGAMAGTSRDAQHVRYMLIRIYAKELEETLDKNRQTPEAQTKLERALNLIDGLDNGRAENQDALERLKYGLLRLSGRAGGSIDTLKTFDECLLRASMEFYGAQSAEAKLNDPANAVIKKDLEETLKKQSEAALAAARKAQSLMKETVSERNRIRILSILQSCLRRTNDGARAALICEYLATSARQPEVAQAAAGEAMRLYQFLSHQGGKEDPVATQRMTAMATFLDQRFPHSPQAAEAQALLGRDLIAKKQYDSAIALLIKIDKNQPAYAAARYYAGVAAWSQHREVNKDKLATKSADSAKALAFLNEAVKAFAELKNKDANDQKLEAQAALLIVGIHDTLGETDQVLQACAPLLSRIEKKEMPGGLPAGTEMQVLETAMSAYIQKRDLQQGAAQILGVIQKRQGDSQLGDVTTFLQKTALRIRKQLDDLQKQGPSAKPQYDAARNSFRQFLEQIEKNPQLPPQQRVWLGTSYSAIGDLNKAAQLLQTLSPPPAGAKEEEVLLYRQAVGLRIAALRQAAMTEADPNDRDKALANVEKEVQGVMKQDWARKNPTLIREEILVMQNRGIYSGRVGAITRWDQFRTLLRPSFDKSELVKDLYWEATFNLTYCLYMEAQMLKDSKAKAKGIDRAAAIVNEARRMKFGGPVHQARYDELLANPKNKDLKDAVDRLNQESAPTPSK